MKIDLPSLSVRAMFEPATANKEARTVEVVWSTGARVLRQSWFDGPWYEELSLKPEHVRMERLAAGAPVLNTHSRYELSDVLGVVEKAWIVSDTEARAILRFSEREDVEPIFRDVASGIIRNISVGYQIHKLREVERDNEIPVMRAEDWTPYEISLVPVGADAKAGVREAERKTVCEVLRSEQPATKGDANVEQERTEETQVPPTSEKAPEVVVDTDAVRNEATTSERRRIADIMEACRKANMSEMAEKFIADGVSVDAARAAVIEKLAERSPRVSTHNPEITRDEHQTRMEAVESALLHRFDTKFSLHEAGRQYRNLSLIEMARTFLQAKGQDVSTLTKNEIAGRAMLGTSDFPAVLANVANKSLRAAYEGAPALWKSFVRIVEVPDFKQVSRVALGGAPALDVVAEKGTITEGTMADAKEAYSIATYAKILNISRQAIINDDMDAFTRIPAMFGRSAAEKEADLVWGVLTANPAMGDTKTLFHADHANLLTGAALDIDAISAARKALRLQTAPNGMRLNLLPKFLLVPAALETTALKLMAQNNPDAVSNVNPFAGSLVVITEARLDDADENAFYMVADPGMIDTIEVAYLQGQRGVYTEMDTDFGTDGVKIKARLDVGAKAIDWRGMVMNPGAT